MPFLSFQHRFAFIILAISIRQPSLLPALHRFLEFLSPLTLLPATTGNVMSTDHGLRTKISWRGRYIKACSVLFILDYVQVSLIKVLN